MTAASGTVRDVIHNYIYFTRSAGEGEVSEETLLDSEWVQRLRQIFQLQTAWLIYPNAVHSRFQHSLGVMHLAGGMARGLYDGFREAFPREEIPEKNHVEEVFRLAGLLHDIGHGPFGHLMDDVYTYPKYGKTHEDISAAVIKGELGEMISRIRSSPGGRFSEPVDPDLIARFIKMPGTLKGRPLWEQVFSKIMLGVCSADAMDFLLRDQYFCGTSEFGRINHRNIIDNLRITRNGMTLRKPALPAFRTFLQTRLNMFRHVYMYEKNELYELAFGRLLPGVLRSMRLGNPLKNLSRFRRITDFGIHSEVAGWSSDTGEKGRIGREWRSLLARKGKPYAKVFEEENFYHTLKELSRMPGRKLLESELRNNYPGFREVRVMVLRNDIRMQNQFQAYGSVESLRESDNVKALSLLDPESGEFAPGEGNRYIRDIPLKYEVVRVYASGRKPEASRGKESLEQGELFPDSAAYADETVLRDDITSM